MTERNLSAIVRIKRISETEFKPNILNQKDYSFMLATDVLRLLEVGEELVLNAVILKRQEPNCALFTNIGLLWFDTEFVEFEGEEVDGIRIESEEEPV